jgi:hypothetical protein
VRLRRVVRELGGEEDEQPGDTSSVTSLPTKQRFGVTRDTGSSFKDLWQANRSGTTTLKR